MFWEINVTNNIIQLFDSFVPTFYVTYVPAEDHNVEFGVMASLSALLMGDSTLSGIQSLSQPEQNGNLLK